MLHLDSIKSEESWKLQVFELFVKSNRRITIKYEARVYDNYDFQIEYDSINV